jgi:hypothetical protein
LGDRRRFASVFFLLSIALITPVSVHGRTQKFPKENERMMRERKKKKSRKRQ